MYNLTNWNASTKALAYERITFSDTACSANPVATPFTSTSTCSTLTNGEGSMYTYTQGITPWDTVVGGVVNQYFYQSGGCSGPPAAFYAQGYDACQALSDGSSSMNVDCSSSSYTTQSFVDAACTGSAGRSYYAKYSCSNPRSSYEWETTTCGTSSENYVLTNTDDDDGAKAVSGAALGVAMTAVVIAVFAVGMFLYYGYGPKKFLRAPLLPQQVPVGQAAK